MAQTLANTSNRVRRRYLLGVDAFLCSGALVMAFGPLGRCLLYTSPSPRD